MTIDKGIASATLADIYLQQGYVEKAIEMYERLLEKEPKNNLYRERLVSLKNDFGEKSKLHGVKKILKTKLW